MTNQTQIVTHVEHELSFTPFQSRWVPSSARFVSLGCAPDASGRLSVLSLSGASATSEARVDRPVPFRCASFGASTLPTRHLATGDFTGELCLWDLESISNPVYSVKDHGDIINCLDGIGGDDGAPEIASGSRDGSVKIWDPRQSTPVASIQADEGGRDCWSLAFGRGNKGGAERRKLAAGYDNGDIKVIDLRRMEVEWEENLKLGICSLEFDGKTESTKNLVATTVGGQFFVYDTLNPDDPPSSQSGQSSTVWSVRHVPQDPRLFLTTGSDGCVNLWRHEEARGKANLLQSSSISSDAVIDFDWHPDKLGLGIAAGFDKTLRILLFTGLALQSAR